MANPAKKLAKKHNAEESLKELDQPKVRWKMIAQITVAFAVLWVTAIMSMPYTHYWGVGIVGALTLVAIGFGVYILRLTRKSSAIVEILKTATDDAGRKAAIEKLGESQGGDVLATLAQAQLVARDKPTEAMRILESIDLKKAPVLVQDDVRANLAFLYLMNNRARDARDLAGDIRLDRQSHPKSRAMYAAVMSESFARTGKEDEAKKLLETFRPGDPAYGEINAMLLRAQVYTYFATKNRGLMRKAMTELAAEEPNMMAPFVQKGTQPELMKLAREVLAQEGFAPRVKFSRAR